MDRTCGSSHIPLCLLFWSVVLVIGIGHFTAADEPSPKVKKLLEASANREGIHESGLFAENPLPAGDVAEALAYIKKHPDYTSYHLLIAIQRYHRDSYKEVSNDDKAAVLCSALSKITFLNDWGYLEPSGSFDGDSAKALLEIGKPALKYLAPILDDSKAGAAVWIGGSHDKPRLQIPAKDFAFRYASLILGEKPAFHRDLKDRDRDIEALKGKLTKDSK